MSELAKFRKWVFAQDYLVDEEDLETQVQAYLSTFPGRILQLLVELLEAADFEEEEK
jgi:hypothetical protein